MALPALATRFSQAGANVSSFAALLPDGTVPGDLVLVFTPYGTNRDLMVLGKAAWDHWGRVTVGGAYLDCWYHVVDDGDRFDGVDDSVTLSVSVQMALAALVVRIRGVTDPARVLGSMVSFTDTAPSVAYPTLDAGTSRLRRWCWFWFGEYGCLPVSHSPDLPDDRFAANSSGGQGAGSFVFATAAATAASFSPADGTATGTNAVGGFGFCFDEDAGVPLGMPTVRIRVTTGGDTNPANLTIAMPEGSDVPGTILVCIAAYDWGNISDPATPAGWTRFAWLNDISGTNEDFAAWYRVVDGTEGFDGSDDTVVFAGGFTQAASHTVFAVGGGYPLADLLASFVYGTQAYAGTGYAARPLDLGTAKRRLWFHGLSTRYGGRSASRGDPAYLHRRFRTFRGARQSQVLIATYAQASASTPAPFVATDDGTAVTWAFAIERGDLVFTPSGFGAEVGIVPGLALVIGAGRMLLPSPRAGLVVGVTPGLRLDVEGPRQVMLAGGPETTALTEGGTEGQVLTYHARRKPTWEAPLAPELTGRWVPLMDGHGNVLTDSGSGAAIMAQVAQE